MATATPTAAPAATSNYSTPTAGTTTTSLSNWTGPYVTDMLGKANAISNEPYQTYQGPLTAGASDLQTQAFNTAGNLQTPDALNQAGTGAQNLQSYSPTQFSGGIFDSQAAQQYMNPYLSAALQPQIDEARRQSQISNLQDSARLTQAGAFGGSRQAIMDSESNRNLGTQLANITGQGYNTAYNNAEQQFNADQARNMTAQQNTEQSKQFGAQQGINNLNAQANIGTQQNNANLQNLNTQLSAGATQQGINQAGVTADYNEFVNQRNDPMAKTQFMQSMLQGLPVATTTYNPAPQSTLNQIVNGASTAGNATNTLLSALGLA